MGSRGVHVSAHSFAWKNDKVYFRAYCGGVTKAEQKHETLTPKQKAKLCQGCRKAMIIAAVKAEDHATLTALGYTLDLAPDWRPAEALPEDHYAA